MGDRRRSRSASPKLIMLEDRDNNATAPLTTEFLPNAVSGAQHLVPDM